MANAAGTLQALNMLLASQERRQQADIQASLGGMELALKERQAEDLSRHRRATEFLQAGQLAEAEKMGAKRRGLIDEQIKTSDIARERAQQVIFDTSLKTIDEGLNEAIVELANNVWHSMGLDRLYDQFSAKAGKDIEASHHEELYDYLSGDKVGFSAADASMISKWVLGYGSMETKNGAMMIKLSNEFRIRMSDQKTNHRFLVAAHNAGMIANIEEAKKDWHGAEGQAFTSAFNMLDKARKIGEYKAYLRKERSELTYQAKKGESVDHEREIRYEFQSPQTLAAIADIGGDVSDDGTTPFTNNRPVFTSTYGAGDEDKASNAVKAIEEARASGDYDYDEDYTNLMGGYVRPTATGYDDKGGVTGWDYSKPIVQRQQDVSGGTGAFDFGWTQADLKGDESALYEKLDEHRTNLNKEIFDARGEIKRLQDEGVNVASMSTLTAMAEDPSKVSGREVDLWREQERLKLLNQQQMILNQQVMKTTTGQWDEWSAFFGGWSDAGQATALRHTLPGALLTKSEREERMSTYQPGGSAMAATMASEGMVNLDVPRQTFFATNPGASLEDYLGQPIASAIVPTDPNLDKQTGEKSYLAKQWDMNVAGKSMGEIFTGGVKNMGKGLYQAGEILGNLTPKFYKP